jgi:hypothetical protein
MSTENKLANKKEEARKLPLGFFTATSYAIVEFYL